MYTLEETANILNVQLGSVVNYIERGYLALENNKVTHASLDAYLRRRVPGYDEIKAAHEWDGWGGLDARPSKIERVRHILAGRVNFKTQTELARELGITRAYVQQLQNWATEQYTKSHTNF